jgi:hypothetical protein
MRGEPMEYTAGAASLAEPNARTMIRSQLNRLA